MKNFVLNGPKPTKQPVTVTLGIDEGGDIGLFYDGIQVAAVGDSTGQIIFIPIRNIADRETLESRGVMLRGDLELARA